MSAHGKQSNDLDAVPSHRPGYCLHCGRWRERLRGRELCYRCHRVPTIRSRYPMLPRPGKPKGPPRPRQLCRHCETRTIYCRRLCRRCFGTPDIRRQYAPVTDTGPKDDGRPVLPALRTYPDPALLTRCEHGLADGECVACERAQRAGMGLEREEADDER